MASQANNQNNTRLAISVSDEIEFKVDNVKRDERDYSENAAQCHSIPRRYNGHEQI